MMGFNKAKTFRMAVIPGSSVAATRIARCLSQMARVVQPSKGTRTAKDVDFIGISLGGPGGPGNIESYRESSIVELCRPNFG